MLVAESDLEYVLEEHWEVFFPGSVLAESPGTILGAAGQDRKLRGD